jgi:hypothetical protein
MFIFFVVILIRFPLRHDQAVRRILCLDFGFDALAPADQRLFICFTEPGVVMDHRIGIQRHIAVVELLDAVIHLLKLPGDPPPRKIIEIEMPLAFFDMIVEPPTHRLDFRIPGIDGLIGMAIRTGSLQDFTYIRRDRIEGGHGSGAFGREIFGGPDELDNDK